MNLPILKIRFPVLLGLVLLGFLAGRTRATTVEAPDFDGLVDSADYVVRAVVKSVTSEWRENGGKRYIASKVELEVRDVIKGTPPTPLILELVGGRIGREELVIEGAPRFNPGEENVLFVQGNGRQFYPLVAIMHGVYPVFRDPRSGLDYIMRSSGRLLYSEQEVALPITSPSPLKRKNPWAMPLTAAAFIDKVRLHRPARQR